jgi:hypothetical protein
MRRGLTIVSAIALVASAAAIAITMTPAAAGPPPPTLNQYVILGTDGVTIGVGSTVIGLVGDSNNNPINNLALRMNGQAQIIGDPSKSVVGDARIGGNTRLDNNAHIEGTLTHPAGTTVMLGVGSTIGPEVVGDPMLPALPAPTPIPGGCPIAAPDLSGGNGATKAPAPGSTNGNWSFGGNFTLNLSAPGNYYFNSISTGNGAVVNAVPGVHVFVCNTVTFGSVNVLPATLTNTDFTLEAQGTDHHNTVRAGGGSQWIGDVFAPNGGIHIGSGGSTASVLGHLWAGGQVDIEHGVVVKSEATGHTNGGAAEKDATLLHGQKVENNGANNSLETHYQVASVVGFDEHALNLATVHHAVLELTVCNTPGDLNFCPDPPSQWPVKGGVDTVHRLDDGWERWGSGFPNPTNTPPEGNGNNFPILDNPRGSGAGVTWDCAIDPNIANEAVDCPASDFWNAGLNFDGPGTDSTPLIMNNMPDGTKIDFDVTADVLKGLGPKDTTFMTWFIRKDSGSGTVFFYSVQGAAAKSDPSLAPQLIIS